MGSTSGGEAFAVGACFAYGRIQMTVISVQTRPTVLATVAHELRGPLSAMATAGELLERDFDLMDRTQARAMVSTINRRTLWLRGLVENLLCAATADDGRLQMQQRPVDLRPLVEDVALLFKPLLERKAQRLRVRVRPLLPVVIGDQQRLSMVLANLLSNASKYADPDTTIGVAVAPRAGAVRVTVTDRGPGVRPENTDQLFQAYNRAGRTDSDGLGIGLSVVRSIIEAHGGKVGYASRSGGGAVFWFELMAARSATSSVGANVRESVG